MNRKPLLTLLTMLTIIITACAPSINPTREPETIPSPIVKTPTTISVLDFNLSSSKDSAPDDVLLEVFFYAGGGGEYCGDLSPEPYISYDPTDTELMMYTTLIACGWQKGETLKGKILYPDGRSISEDVQVEDTGFGYYYGLLGFEPNANDPVGVYTFLLEGKNGKVESNAYFRDPSGPRIFQVSKSQWLLYDFVPGESVNLLYYRKRPNSHDGDFQGWIKYSIPSSGKLEINMSGSLNDGYLIAIGSKTGEVHPFFDGPFGGSFDLLEQVSTSPTIEVRTYNQEEYRTCLDQQVELSNLHAQERAWVTGSKDKGASLYANPRQDARVIKTLPIGTELPLIYGPYCLDGVIWWEALNGYIIERDAAGQYFVGSLKPMGLFCDGLPSRLAVGEKARVAFTDGTKMRIRKNIGFDSEILYKVPEGTEFRIIDGPECSDHIIWWKVRTDNNQEGWMAEYQENVYLLEPWH